MLNARSIQGIFILSLGLFVAIWLGLSIATNQSETIIQFAGPAMLLICTLLGRKIWLLLILYNVHERSAHPRLEQAGTAETQYAEYLRALE